ncbi:hypothetical protein BIW11_04649 [Tropilaelaps mercedesae]|uniref:Uncharacterized protein n=1 Tax=Tropilaelaps mercedesae TaxID=418985 RepID=A0A1V9X2Y6_9ACAR|nr:hypothetical protein BIW11_04649 [Tropilaelaps mercedesae]
MSSVSTMKNAAACITRALKHTSLTSEVTPALRPAPPDESASEDDTSTSLSPGPSTKAPLGRSRRVAWRSFETELDIATLIVADAVHDAILILILGVLCVTLVMLATLALRMKLYMERHSDDSHVTPTPNVGVRVAENCEAERQTSTDDVETLQEKAESAGVKAVTAI